MLLKKSLQPKFCEAPPVTWPSLAGGRRPPDDSLQQHLVHALFPLTKDR